MQIYTGLCYSKKFLWYFRKYHLGMMLSTVPSQGWFRAWYNEFPLALDNGAFGAWQRNEPFPEGHFLRALGECLQLELELDFIVVPDLVGQGVQSLKFSLEWLPRLRSHGMPLALALQDGMSRSAVMEVRGCFDVLFVGGTNQWKWATAHMWRGVADEWGVPLHIGRCGTLSKLQQAQRIGADSVDSTSLIRNGVYPRVLEELANPSQMLLNI